MFAYCKNKKCDYHTKDFDSVQELKEQVKKDSGQLELDTICPKYSYVNTLTID